MSRPSPGPLTLIWYAGLALFMALIGAGAGTVVGTFVAIFLFGFDLDGKSGGADEIVFWAFVAAGIGAGIALPCLLFRRRYYPGGADEALRLDYADRETPGTEP